MKFSVIVPVYNVQKYLKRCLDSVLNQTYKNYEIILIDDGSTDCSGDICDQYEKKYNDVKVIHQENQGLSAARNCGLEAAKGEWIVFVDSDDWIEQDMLRTISEYMKETDADLYGFNTRKVDENNMEAGRLLFSVENNTMYFFNEEEKFDFFFYKLMQYKIGWEVCFKVYKKSIIEEKNLRFVSTEKIFAEDYLFTFQYMLYVDKIAFLCNIFYNYFQRNDSLLHSTVKRSILPKLYWLGKIGYRTICREHMKYFRKNYQKLYFMLLNHHIQFSLRELEEDVLKDNLEKMAQYQLHRKWMKKIEKEKESYQKYMENRTWL